MSKKNRPSKQYKDVRRVLLSGVLLMALIVIFWISSPRESYEFCLAAFLVAASVTLLIIVILEITIYHKKKSFAAIKGENDRIYNQK